MNTLASEASALDIWFDSDSMWVAIADGRQLSIPLSFFPRLLNATQEQRLNFELSGGGTGIHWPEIDEDISVQGLLLGIPDRTKHSA